MAKVVGNTSSWDFFRRFLDYGINAQKTEELETFLMILENQ